MGMGRAAVRGVAGGPWRGWWLRPGNGKKVFGELCE